MDRCITTALAQRPSRLVGGGVPVKWKPPLGAPMLLPRVWQSLSIDGYALTLVLDVLLVLPAPALLVLAPAESDAHIEVQVFGLGGGRGLGAEAFFLTPRPTPPEHTNKLNNFIRFSAVFYIATRGIITTSFTIWPPAAIPRVARKSQRRARALGGHGAPEHLAAFGERARTPCGT